MTSNDELERQRFQEWFAENESVIEASQHEISAKVIKIVAERAWLARSKQEQSDG